MANIVRSNPIEDLFNEFRSGFWVRPFSTSADTELKMKIDVKEDGKGYAVRAEIPGVNKEDINVEINGDRVSIRAEVKKEKQEKKDEKVVYSECSYGMVSRSFSLPSDVDSKTASAEYKDGVLNLTLPKKSNGATSRVTVK